MTEGPWVQIVRDTWADALVYEPLRCPHSLTQTRPSLVSLVGQHGARNVNTEPGISVSSKMLDTNPAILCSVHLTTNKESEPCEPRRPKDRFRLNLEKYTVDDYLRRIVHALSDVVCLWATDLDGAVNETLSWIESCVATVACQALPAAIIIVDHVIGDFRKLSSDFEALCARKLEDRSVGGSRPTVSKLIHQCFRNIVVLQRVDDLALSTRIADCIEVSRRHRERLHHMWNVRTLVSLFERACCRFATEPHRKFDFVEALRADALPSLPFRDKSLLDEYLRLQSTVRTLRNFVASAVARLLVQDSRKISGHRFSAAHLFSVLYEGICRDAYTQVASERQWARELNLEDFLRLVTECMAAHLDSPTTMKNSLRELWRGVSGLRVCVTCPFSRSHIFLRCGHGLCERCCWSRSRRDHFGTLCRLDRCPVCGVCISLAVRLKPPAAGYRGLALDGGGTRGMVELEILEHMAASLDVGLEPYQFFDIIAGTSTGAIVASVLGIKKWPIKRCIDEFARVAGAVFTHTSRLRSLFASVMSLFTDYKYSSRSFHKTLQRIFGSSTLLYGETSDSGRESPEYIKIIVTATTMSSRAAVLSNYLRTPGFEAPSYDTPQEHDQFLNVEIWKAIAASCAAPFFFLPVMKLQDGGLLKNNPIDVLRDEIALLTLEDQPPDFLASLGTGSFSEPPAAVNETIPRYPRRVHDCFMARMDGQAIYDQHKTDRSFRFNPAFPPPEIALDDANAVPRLQKMTKEQLGTNPTLLCTAEKFRIAIICTSFYLHFLSYPVYNEASALYHCETFILLRWQDDDFVCRKFRKLLVGSRFYINQVPYEVSIPFRASFTIATLHENLSVLLEMRDGSYGSISGLPMPPVSILRLQGYVPETNFYVKRRWSDTNREGLLARKKIRI